MSSMNEPYGDEPSCRKADYFARWVDDSVAQLVKKAVLSPEYMKSAWRSEVEYQKAFGITPEELLVESLQPRAHKLPALAGCHVFPIFPGPAASYAPPPPSHVLVGLFQYLQPNCLPGHNVAAALDFPSHRTPPPSRAQKSRTCIILHAQSANPGILPPLPSSWGLHPHSQAKGSPRLASTA